MAPVVAVDHSEEWWQKLLYEGVIYLLNICGKFQTAPVDIPKTSAPREFASSLLIINAQVLFSGCCDSTLTSKYFHGLTQCMENLELTCIWVYEVSA